MSHVKKVIASASHSSVGVGNLMYLYVDASKQWLYQENDKDYVTVEGKEYDGSMAIKDIKGEVWPVYDYTLVEDIDKAYEELKSKRTG